MDVDITRAQTGMSLNRDVIDRRGHVLLKSGLALTGRHLDLIRAHGIAHIDIAPVTPVAGSSQDWQPLPPERLFRNLNPQHPLAQELLRVYQTRYALTKGPRP